MNFSILQPRNLSTNSVKSLFFTKTPNFKSDSALALGGVPATPFFTLPRRTPFHKFREFHRMQETRVPPPPLVDGTIWSLKTTQCFSMWSRRIVFSSRFWTPNTHWLFRLSLESESFCACQRGQSWKSKFWSFVPKISKIHKISEAPQQWCFCFSVKKHTFSKKHHKHCWAIVACRIATMWYNFMKMQFWQFI